MVPLGIDVTSVCFSWALVDCFALRIFFSSIGGNEKFKPATFENGGGYIYTNGAVSLIPMSVRAAKLRFNYA